MRRQTYRPAAASRGTLLATPTRLWPEDTDVSERREARQRRPQGQDARGPRPQARQRPRRGAPRRGEGQGTRPRGAQRRPEDAPPQGRRRRLLSDRVIEPLIG